MTNVLKLLFCLIYIAHLGSCQSGVLAVNDRIEIIEKFSELEAKIDADSQKICLVNFWATSCPPCIKEMPHFKKLMEEYDDQSLKIILVSLDRVADLEKRVYPFVKRHKIVPEVVILKDQNYSAWTDKIDSSWYGALPATLIKYKNQRKFRFGMYESYESLLSDLKSMVSSK